ncbi:MAG: histidinol-phosphatase [Sarcina sp.]
MRVNYHTHTYRCKHAIGTEEEFVKAAIENNVSILGFSDHIAYPDDRSGNRMQYDEVKPYVAECFRLKEKYKDEIDILVGFESEYDIKCHDYYEYLFKELKIEYLVLGQHYFEINGKFYNTFKLESTEDYVVYAKTVAEALKTDYFKILAHPDVIFVNDLAFDDNCRQAIEILIEAIKEANIVIEFNANGIRRGFIESVDGERYRYPYMEFWKRAQQENLRVIVSSDCHNPIYMWDKAMVKAYDMATNLGLNLVFKI